MLAQQTPSGARSGSRRSRRSRRPLFTVAAGLVVDIGGALSHGSTVAGEYGLPAGVNVKVATRLIRTGDTITVDGTRGVVVLGR